MRIADHPGVTIGLDHFLGVAAALFKRERTGEPSVVDISLLSTAMWNISADVTMSKALEKLGLDNMNREQILLRDPAAEAEQ